MQMTRTVTYHIYKPDGTPWVGVRPSFALLAGSFTQTGEQPPATVLGSATDTTGAGSVTLWCNAEGVIPSYYRCTLPNRENFTFVLAAGTGSVELSALHLNATAPDNWQVTVQSLISQEASDRSAADAALQAQISALGGAYQAENKDTVTIAPGQPIAANSGSAGMVRAGATNIGLRALGLCGASTAPAVAGPVRMSSDFTLNDWSAVTGTTTLIPRQRYYLDTTPGKLTTNPPSSVFIQIIGVALTTQTLVVEIGDPFITGA